ncbi:MAG: hypothetical protein GC136_02930 [Alphaproteobacteria bacterium]|nr:hypothetical protein [Alphaproteobacteria bacterium]
MWFFLYALPILLFIAQIAIELLVPQTHIAAFHNEGGPHETFEALLLLGGILFAAKGMMLSHKQGDKPLFIWFLLAFLGCFYTCGEELSWGQHIFEWHTPEFWAGVNNQNETNLHNTSALFDQIPRLILFLGVVGGALLLPLGPRFSLRYPKLLERIRPPASFWLIAVFVIFFHFAKHMGAILPLQFERPKEVEEVYLFYFVSLYLWTLLKTVSQPQE